MRATFSSAERRSFAVGLLALLVATSAGATTITVTSTSDAVNGADGVCTLREALLAASTNTASGGVAGECAAGQAAPTVDVIAFAIPGSGVKTIAPTAAFAAIGDPVTIDGYTQAGASVNTLPAGSNAVLRVVVDASAVGGTTPLLRFAAGSAGSQVRGLAVQNFAVPAIALDAVANVKVAGNFIGTSADGTLLAANGAAFAITLQGASGAVIGGSTAADRNVIAGGSAAQVFVQGGAGAQVLGNLIGTNALGTAALDSASSAIGLWVDAPGVQVGGSPAGAGNLISGNAKGVVIQGANAGAVQGNRIGTDATGTKPLPNAFYGVEIAAPGPGLIGGTAGGEGNVIAFNGGPGVYVNAPAGGWRIVGNATFDNGDKGIALASGPLPLANDALDTDTGANARQNFPLIDTVTLSPTSVRVQGRIESGPSRSLVLDVYASRPPVRPTSLLQGEVYLGAAPATITTDAQGKASFDVTLPVTTTPNLWVTATSTDVTDCPLPSCGDTSEFAQRSVFAVAPRWGSATGQVPVTLLGQGFQPGASFAFGATNANGVAFVDAQTLTGQLPLLNPGTLYDVTVTNPDTSTATMRKGFVTDFVDVPPSSVWYGSVMNLAAAGITSGCLPGQYCGTSEVTRAQMALFLTRGRHGPFFVPPPATGIFADVPLGAFAVDWIEQFYGEGITSGCAANPLRYCPDTAVSRGQMAVFLLRSKHGSSYVPPPCTGLFADVPCTPPAHPFVNWIEQLAREGITAGCAANPARYCPDATVLRLAMAAFIARTFGLDEATNQAPQVSAGANQAVKLPASASLSGAVTDDGLPSPPGTLTLAWSKQSGPGTVTFGNPAAAWTTASFSAAGTYVLRLTASDGALSAFDETTVTVQAAGATNVPPTVNAGPDQTITLPASANLSGSAGDDGLPNPPGSISVRWSQLSGPGTATFGNFTAAVTTASFSAPGTYALRLSINDGAITSVDDLQVTVNPDPGALPPEPSTVAPPVDRSVATLPGVSTAFLYTGANPIQTGVAPGTIDLKRAAILRGRVLDRGGAAVPGVRIDILAHPEFGQTLTRADGRFDLVVNGGGPVAVNYGKAGFLPVQRQVDAPWQDFVVMDDVVMIPVDPQVTPFTSGAGAMQVARGSPQTDASGTRRGTVLFPAGTTAALVQPDGSTVAAPTLSVRLTEYTTGPSGPQAMPGPLPPASAYTYAIELGVDEAVAKVNGRDVVFDRPVFYYVENFLGFPVGTIVPAGFYHRDRAAWVGSENGRVVKITGVTAGLADVDTVGSSGLPPLSLGAEERQQLAALYAIGQELWRVPTQHFSTLDLNFPRALPPDATAPNQPDPEDDQTVDQCIDEAAGSIIECQNQVLGQSVPIVGTPYTLNYRSLRTAGYGAGNTLRIPLSGAAVPNSLKRIDVTVEIAGRSFPQTFPAAPNQEVTFVWDGKDAYGRTLQGRQIVTTRVSYIYEAIYLVPASVAAGVPAFGAFGVPCGSCSVIVRADFPLRQVRSKQLGSLDAVPLGLGGWVLSPHHLYEPTARTAHLGTGARQAAAAVKAKISTLAGTGFSPGIDADGIPATQATVAPRGVAVAADNTVYIADASGKVRRVGADGLISTFAGGGAPGNVGDGGPATAAELKGPQGLAVGADGSVYIAESSGHRLRRVAPDGIITTVAGNGVAASSGDGGPATAASIISPQAVAVAPDGRVYFTELNGNSSRIRSIAADGIVTTLAGGTLGPIGDGGLATAAFVAAPRGIAVAPDGGIVYADQGLDRVRRIGADGLIATLATTSEPVGITITPAGAVFVSDRSSSISRVFRLAQGVLIPFAGNGRSDDYSGENVPATQAVLNEPEHLAAGPDGTIYVHDNDGSSSGRVHRITGPFPGFDNVQSLVADAAGRVVHGFDAFGRHLVSSDALTGTPLNEFTYDSEGRLASVIERTGGIDNVTTIQRDAGGQPTAIVGPYGHVTTLATDANGMLSSIANPAGETIGLAYAAAGLLSAFTDARGKVKQYAFDDKGRLTQATDPAGNSLTLTRARIANGHTVTKTTALGRATVYKVERLDSGDQQFTTTLPSGESSVLLAKTDGSYVATRPDGTVVTTITGPDPRFGMQVPFATSVRTRTPAGLQRITTERRTVTPASLGSPFSFASLQWDSRTSGRLTQSVYTAATRTLVTTSPQGRVRSTTLDARGRLVAAQSGGLAPQTATYDTRGRLASLVAGTGAGARTTTFGYDAQGFLASVTDPGGRTAQFVRDAAGRVVSKTLPDGRVIASTYDAAGNRATLAPPSAAVFAHAYSDRNELLQESPPAVAGTGPTLFGYDADGAMVGRTDPDNRSIELGYDSAGRLGQRRLSTGGVPSGTDVFAYDAAGRLAGTTAAAGIGHAFAYDGPLFKGEALSGALAGTQGLTYDATLRLVGESINGGNLVAIGYDNDDLPTSIANLTITRSSQNAYIAGTTLGVVATTATRDSFGDLSAYAATSSGTPIYSVALVRDALGRIAQKTETIGGATDVFAYAYDPIGQLVAVTRNAVPAEAYTFDPNGNRTSATVGGTTVNATYDAQDRLLQQGAVTLVHGPAGDLVSRTESGQTTAYQYDQAGNLRSVALPGGPTVTYTVDGRDRRVARRVDGVLVQQFLYSDALRPAAELDAGGNVVSRFAYAGGGAPVLMVKGGSTFRIIADPNGNVRLVVDAATGAIAQRIDYDAFGNVTLDTNPGFQPFGFNGGLYDPLTRLVRFGARDYDPRTGRWTSKDPIGFAGGDGNLYRYVGNDPVNRSDPTGKSMSPPQDDGLSLMAAVTMVKQMFNPETGEPLETAAEAAGRRTELARNRLAGTPDRISEAEIEAGIQKALRRAQIEEKFARCGLTIPEALARLGRGLKGLEGLGLFEAVRTALEAAWEGREASLSELAEAYLGFPILDPALTGSGTGGGVI